MATQHSQEPNETVRNARLALLRQYIQAGDATARNEIEHQLMSTILPDEHGAARARLLDWLAEAAGDPESNEHTPDLLLKALTSQLAVGSAEESDFQELIEGEEKHWAVPAALEAGITAWAQAAGPLTAFPTFDLSFLAAGDVWAAELVWTLEVVAAQRRAQVRIPFRSVAGSPRHIGMATAGEPISSLRDMLVVTLGPAPERDLPNRYQITVQAQRTTATMCRLLVNVRGRGLRKRMPELLVTLAHPGVPDRSMTPTAQSTATFEDLPIVALDGLTVTISLPTALEAEPAAE